MAFARTRPYCHNGVFIPFAPARKEKNEWFSDKGSLEDGFILVHEVWGVYVVQSVKTGELFIQKYLRRYNDRNRIPEELRISTCPQAIVRLPRPFTVERSERIHFNEMVGWQKHNEGRYILYFR